MDDTADTVKDALLSIIQEAEIPKIIGFGSDGASVMGLQGWSCYTVKRSKSGHDCYSLCGT